MSDTTAGREAGGSRLTEDTAALAIGLVVVAIALIGASGADLLGWVVTSAVWTDVSKSLAPASKAFAGLGGLGSLVLTFVVLLAALTASAVALGLDAARFALRFAALFWIAYQGGETQPPCSGSPISAGSSAATRISPS